ncbi:MAG: SprB repeat-containing protein, partial [Bacteroidia bacterium]|nr:SprB repeat-containing protein [Bacteroidia bacterium]
MKNFKSLINSLILCLFVALNFMTLKAQDQSYYNTRLAYKFSVDSLAGFDEEAAIKGFSLDGFEGKELRWVTYNAKRNYVNAKYNLIKPQVQINQSYSNFKPIGGNLSVNAAPCVNEDFEASPVGQVIGNTLAGWGVGSMNNPCCGAGAACVNLATVTAGSSECWVRATPMADPWMGTLPNSPLGGTKVLQMNDNNWGSLTTRISQTFPVAATNALFQFAYAGVWDGSGHACCDQPSLKITLKNCAGVPLACPAISLTPSGAACASGVPGYTVTGGVSWTNWVIKSLDLTPFIGTCVTIEVTVSDCDGGAHQGYCYFDAICKPMTIQVNSALFPAGTAAATVVACGVTTATVVAPIGLGPYLWNGPAGSGITNNTNAQFQTTTAGTYTLTMTPPGSCAPIVKLVTLSFAPSPNANFNNISGCNTFTFNNLGNPAPAIQTYSFVGTAPPPSFTTTATTTVVTFPTAGTYTVLHSINNSGCTATVQAVIVVAPPINPAFTVPTPTQCLNGNSYSFAASLNVGTHSYTFNPAAGAPAVGNAANYGPGSFTAPGTYTVTHTVSSGGCTAFTSSVVSISPHPSLTLVPTNAICGNNNGSIVINNTTPAGQTVISFSMNGTAIVTQTPTGLPTGAYTIAFTNNFGCITSSVTNIANTPGVTNLATTFVNPACGNANGSITLGVVTGGTGPYTYSVNNGPFSAAPPLTNLAAGNYTITVKDVNNCVFTTVVTLVNTIPPSNVTFTTSPTACVGNTGVLGITGVTGGVAPFTFSVNGVSTGSVTGSLAFG